MGKNTNIEWADHTFNPWIGCTKISPGCENCYAKSMMEGRWKKVVWGKGKPRERKKHWSDPVKWNSEAGLYPRGYRQKVFCASLGDVFDEEVDKTWRDDLFALIQKTPALDWLLLTKRAQFMVQELHRLGSVPGNVWLGVSVENQKMANERIPWLIEAPEVAVKFLSMEPLLEAVDLGEWLIEPIVPSIDWVVVGGETGKGARKMEATWVTEIRDQCQLFTEVPVPFFFKQWGAPVKSMMKRPLVEGREWKQWPVTQI